MLFRKHLQYRILSKHCNNDVSEISHTAISAKGCMKQCIHKKAIFLISVNNKDPETPKTYLV